MIPEFSAGKLVVVVFALGLFFLSVIGWVSYRSTTQLIQLGQSRNRAHGSFEHLQELFSELQDAETGQRGYVITGDDRYLAPYLAATQSIDQTLRNIQISLPDSPTLETHFGDLKKLAAQKLNELQEVIETRRSKGLDAALPLVQTGQGKKTMDRIRDVMAAMRTEQFDIISQRTVQMQAVARMTTGVILFGSLLSVLVVGLATLVIHRELGRRQKAEDVAAHLAAIVESSEDAIISKTLEGKILSWNKGAEHMYGYTAAEALGQYVSFLLPPGHADELPEIIRKLKTQGSIEQRETVRMKKDGTLIDVSLTISPIIDRSGTVTGASSIARNITLRKQAEEALRASEERLSVALESAQTGIWELDLLADTSIRSLRHDQIFGYSQILPKWGFEIFMPHVVPEDCEAAKRSFEEALRRGQLHLECRIIRANDRAVRWISAQGRVVRNDKGEPVRMYGVVADVTERKQAEEEIRALNLGLQRRTAELIAVNRELEAFSYSVSHDLRAPLRSIDGFSQALLEDYEQKLDDSGKDFIHRVRASTQRMAQLIDDLINLSRVTRAELRHEAVDLSAIARSIAEELQTADQTRIMQWAIADGLKAQGDERLLRVVLENLLGNAWKFTSRRPTARIEVGTLNHSSGIPVFFVRDDGAGFDASYAQKLFTPFQRLHSSSEFKGTGIGLATVQRIIHRHGGRVWAESQVDQGASFYFTLRAEETVHD